MVKLSSTSVFGANSRAPMSKNCPPLEIKRRNESAAMETAEKRLRLSGCLHW